MPELDEKQGKPVVGEEVHTHPAPKSDAQGDTQLASFKEDMERKFAEFKAEANARETVLKSRLEKAEKKASDAERKQEEQDIALYCKDLASKQMNGTDGSQCIVAPAAIEILKPIVEHADNSHVVEFSDTDKVAMRPAIQRTLSTLLNMAAAGTLLVPVGGLPNFQQHTPPEEEAPEQKEVNRASILDMYGEDAKAALGLVEVTDTNQHAYLMKAHEVAAVDDYRRIIGG